MKTSKFAIALIALLASNAHAQLAGAPLANAMEVAQICRAEAEQRELAAGTRISLLGRRHWASAQQFTAELNRLINLSKVARGDASHWHNKMYQAQQQGIAYNSDLASKLTNVPLVQGSDGHIHLDKLSRKLFHDFYQDCENSK